MLYTPLMLELQVQLLPARKKNKKCTHNVNKMNKSYTQINTVPTPKDAARPCTLSVSRYNACCQQGQKKKKKVVHETRTVLEQKLHIVTKACRPQGRMHKCHHLLQKLQNSGNSHGDINLKIIELVSTTTIKNEMTKMPQSANMML